MCARAMNVNHMLRMRTSCELCSFRTASVEFVTYGLGHLNLAICIHLRPILLGFFFISHTNTEETVSDWGCDIKQQKLLLFGQAQELKPCVSVK